MPPEERVFCISAPLSTPEHVSKSFRDFRETGPWGTKGEGLLVVYENPSWYVINDFFFNFRPTVLHCGVQELWVRLVTADLLPLLMAQIAEHAMYVYFNQILKTPAVNDCGA